MSCNKILRAENATLMSSQRPHHNEAMASDFDSLTLGPKKPQPVWRANWVHAKHLRQHQSARSFLLSLNQQHRAGDDI